MKKLIIYNIGPIKHAELNLKRVNVIIGPQSAGKSCILKIACFCAWAEKRIQLEQGKNGFADSAYLEENLINYHKLEGFFEHGKKSSFRYETKHLWFQFDYDDLNEPFKFDWKKNGHWKYKRTRVSYIPAERNAIATIPNWLDVSMKYTYIRNFVSDWMLTRSFYTKDNKLDILSLGVKYYYDEKSGQDLIELENGKPLQFANGSSGIQSAVPMLVYLGFLFDNQYHNGQYGKISTESENEEILNHIYDKKYKRGLKSFMEKETPYIGKIGLGKRFFKSEDAYKECKELFDSYTKTSCSDIYLEEPEQNLFPETQINLIYDIISKSFEHNDCVFLATHSPFILFAINNCIMGGLVGNNINEDVRKDLLSAKAWISPAEVTLYELKDGGVQSLQDEDSLLSDNYLNKAYRNVSSEFMTLLNYYSYATKNNSKTSKDSLL